MSITAAARNLHGLFMCVSSYYPLAVHRHREYVLSVGVANKAMPQIRSFRARTKGRRPNGLLGLSLNDRNIIFLVILLDKTVSVR